MEVVWLQWYFSQGTSYYTALVVPDSVTSQLLHRDDAQINFLEMLAVVELARRSFFSSTTMASLVP